MGETLTGETTATETSTWKFEDRGDNTFNIVNRKDQSYVSPVATYNTALTTTAAEPDAGWEFKEAATTGYYIIVSGDVQFNQTKSDLGWKVYNWGSGTNTSDTGCQYAFTLVEEETVPTGITTAKAAGKDVPCYDLSGRRVTKPAKGVYILNGEKIIGH